MLEHREVRDVVWGRIPEATVDYRAVELRRYLSEQLDGAQPRRSSVPTRTHQCLVGHQSEKDAAGETTQR